MNLNYKSYRELCVIAKKLGLSQAGSIEDLRRRIAGSLPKVNIALHNDSIEANAINPRFEKR